MEPLQVQDFDERVFRALGITAGRQGFRPILLGSVQPVVQLPLPSADSGVSDPLFADEVVAAGEAFSASSSAGPVAAQVALAQLWNPSSDKVLYVDGIDVINLSVTDRLELRAHTATVGGAIEFGHNQSLGGAPGSGQLYAGAAAAPGGTVIQEAGALVNVLYRWTLSPPIRILPSNGLTVLAFAVNTSVLATFRWREKLLT